VKELQPNKVFIDINGSRMLRTVQEVLQIVEREIKPDVIVVKSSELYKFLQ
jgi:hypothetical protein